MKQKITTFLTFNNQVEEAMNLYLSVFTDSKVLHIMRTGEATPGTRGTLLSATIELCGQKFILMNGGPHFSFAPGISLFVDCETQEEIDAYWEKLSESGEQQPCGWLRDPFGVSWQIVPHVLGELLSDPDPEKVQRVVQAMLKMSKLEIKTLQAAYEGR